MGCNLSSSTKNVNPFGVKGVHVGRDGDVDLTSRSISYFGLDFVGLINTGELHTPRKLHLTDNKLYTLGKEMTLLPDIEEIYIDCNIFERLPVVLGDMPRLCVVDASSNNLGHHVHALDAVSRIANLTRLVLRNCSLTTIPACVLRCPVLKELDVSNNGSLNFGGVQFSQLPMLVRLFIADCGIVGELPNGVRNLQSLETLDVSGNVFEFENPDFFGEFLCASLTELHLRDLYLAAVPRVVIKLRKLATLDLSRNPLETLDVIAGRLVREFTSRGSMKTSISSNLINEHNDDATSVGSQSSAAKSFGQNNRKGCIVAVPQPIPLKTLSLRACSLRTLPKYFHRLTSLVKLDLSDNDQLDDPNLTFISFKHLQELNIVGCPFAVNIRGAKNEWLDIGSLGSLHTLHWESWKGGRNISPYRTRVPLEICGLNLQRINCITLRKGLFVGDTVQTMVNLLMDGYFKVDIAIDDELVPSHLGAVCTLHPLGWFFFSSGEAEEGPTGNNDKSGRCVGNGGGKDDECSAKKPQVADPGENVAPFFSVGNHPSDGKLRRDVLQIVISRYIFFLAMQAANFKAVIVPPVDVMAIHYAQMTQDPVAYRRDCEAVCRQVLNCNYRMLFLQKHEDPQGVKETLAASKHVWDRMIRTVQKDLHWLHYDFWELRAKQNPSSRNALQDGDTVSSIEDEVRDILATFGVSGFINGKPLASSVVGNLDGLHNVNSVADLSAVLDPFITAHFQNQSMDRFAVSLQRFFSMNNHFIEHEEKLKVQFMDWTRYVKYLALYAQINRLKDPKIDTDDGDQTATELKNLSIFSSDSYLPRPQKSIAPLQAALRRSRQADSSKPSSVHGHQNGTDTGNTYHGHNGPPNKKEMFKSQPPSKRPSVLSRRSDTEFHGHRRQRQLSTTDPVPTIGITLLLHCHRTDHVKYKEVLHLLGIDNVDVMWEETTDAVDETMRSWNTLYGEHYVEDVNIAFVSYAAKYKAGGNTHVDPTSRDHIQTSAAVSHRRTKSKRSDKPYREVSFCCADSQKGIY
ncbi:hypothetical protein, conserved [Trypanosoma brucei gambiense DAL972]|uniref:Leucine-rich repeat protein (LRRP) n=1 Tax=Trypanosoma brucei gambiense (strain MHOM/CI/86/DAL972) TaxID=679716 RepID=C9ZTM0_TRYB9|nr:hypothetical protein, conserved [Trypanosoma brucei gambiense DAL972]CBH12755.1 hypothetical protein, conserved [Trypanosoma brucei gambiense DAL972]|eukprot:XP_011775035.1 hypothetical protein, conserved [Trypanosoma brucei gambiense DAL972]